MSLTDDTARVLKLINIDQQYEFNEHQAGSKPIILNHYDLSEPEYIERLNAMISSDGSGSDFIARCQCGDLEGNNRQGMTCKICLTTVAVNNLLDENHLICRNWLSCPKELPNGWLAPKIYLNLAEWLTYDRRKRNYLDDILDVTTEIPFELRDVVTGKGFGYLYENFDRLMDYFVHNHPVISLKPDTVAMKYCLAMNREKVFCHYIPVLNSALSPTSNEGSSSANKKRYTDTTSDNILKAAISLSRLEYAPKRKNRQYHVEETTFDAFKSVIAYVENATKKYISHKKAIPRTHLFGARFHLSFRGVVTPITAPHNYDELHVPWKLAVNTFRVHIYSYLLKEYQLSINDAVTKLHRALQIFDADIYAILNRLIVDSPFKGIPCFWDRPPSIRDGSVMLKYITLVKTDLNDSTVSIGVIDSALPNLDFDGDLIITF